jgi:iron complex transport system substrate-binding protein
VQYDRLKKLAAQKQKKPTIFSGKKIGQVWYVPGGESYMAEFFEDAGANYIWKENQKTGSLPLDFETVFYKAQKADYWCIKENYQGRYTYKDLQSEYMHYSEFDAFKNHRVLFCNTHTKPYFEKGVLEPDVILADMIHILHPGLLPDHKNKYYKYLNREK